MRPTCDRVIHFPLMLGVAMASSAVSSVLFLRDAAGHHAGTRTGTYICYGDAASFHEWELRTRLRIAGQTCDQYIEAISKVCDGLRGDAFVATCKICGTVRREERHQPRQDPATCSISTRTTGSNAHTRKTHCVDELAVRREFFNALETTRSFLRIILKSWRIVDYGFCYPVNRSFTVCHPLTL